MGPFYIPEDSSISSHHLTGSRQGHDPSLGADPLSGQRNGSQSCAESCIPCFAKTRFRSGRLSLKGRIARPVKVVSEKAGSAAALLERL